MSLTDTISFDKASTWRKFFLSLVIILVAALSFGLGRLSVVGNKEPIRIEYDAPLTSQTSQTISAFNSLTTPSGVIASKNGKKYHYPHCAGAKQIAEKNKITFSSPEAAEASGYTLASNCSPR